MAAREDARRDAEGAASRCDVGALCRRCTAAAGSGCHLAPLALAGAPAGVTVSVRPLSRADLDRACTAIAGELDPFNRRRFLRMMYGDYAATDAVLDLVRDLPVRPPPKRTKP